jgi:hypothetical protein
MFFWNLLTAPGSSSVLLDAPATACSRWSAVVLMPVLSASFVRLSA